MEHWSFWFGGIALGVVAVGYVAAVRRPFGVSGAVKGVLAAGADDDASDGCGVAAPGTRPLRFAEQLAFLLSISAGAALSSLLAGNWGRSLDDGLGADFAALFGRGPASWALIAGGGVLVGVGTQWARGCTSGHGLMGVSRLEKSSLVATAVFFGTAIAVSLVVDAVLR